MLREMAKFLASMCSGPKLILLLQHNRLICSKATCLRQRRLISNETQISLSDPPYLINSTQTFR